MKQTLKEDLLAKMQATAERSQKQRDDEHRAWLEQEGLFEGLKYPELLKMPSERTSGDILAIITRDLGKDKL